MNDVINRLEINRKLKEKLLSILGQHVRPEDISLTDHGLILEVLKRYAKFLEEPIIDVGE